MWQPLSAFEINVKWLVLKLIFMIFGNQFGYHLQRWSLKLKNICLFERHDLNGKFIINFISAQTELFHFGDMTSSCFLWFSPRGQVSISHANSDYSGDISGEKETTCKIMIKVPMNLISWDSSMEMHQMNALSIVSAKLKYRWSMYSPLPWLEVSQAVISWEVSSQIEMMDSKPDSVYMWNYSPSFRKHKVHQHCMKIGQ